MRRFVIVWIAASAALGCAGNKETVKPDDTPAPEEEPTPPGFVKVVEYEAKTRELIAATEKVEALQGDIDEQRRRLQVICADHPKHVACDLYSAQAFARKTYCEDQGFTQHVDGIVSSCNQGACKQVDEAALLSRTDYMTLVQHLPHKLVTFKSAQTTLDANDKKSLQQYLEAVRGDEGYIIIVGRASREGPWEDNLRYAVDRAEAARKYIVETLGFDQSRVGYITYGHEKMYLTDLDVERLSEKKMSTTEANRSALIFTYPCFKQ
ncbi:MAG: OmpA family protein [Deltaproteobacteria bacterium]|nr:OmpA family protein [Deltaproteobacteria bacterium]